MQTIERKQIVSYSREQMYDFVNDVERYPEFIPLCHQGVIHECDSHHMCASLVFGRGMLSAQLTTNNVLARPSRIEMSFESGPLESLKGLWQFTQDGQQTLIEFSVSFEISSGMFMLKPMLTSILDTMVARFCERAKEIYD